MKISEFSVKNSLLINLISIFILLAGFFTVYVYKIRREAFPEVSYDVVVVTTIYPGAPPQEIEKLITVPIEKELKGVDGIEDMFSSSIDNTSSVLIKINQDVKDKKRVVRDIQTAVDRVRDLPDSSEEPFVNEITSGQMPVVEVALSGDISEKKLQAYADRLEDILEDIPGVSNISMVGYRDKEVWIEVDPEKMKAAYLSLSQVIEALKQRNISIPGGKLRGKQEFNIRTSGEFFTKEDIENVVIRANESGNWLRVKDIAEVKFSFEDEDIINKSYGTRSINLTVIKRSTGDAIKIVDQVKEETNNFTAINKDLKVSFIDDVAFYINRRLGVLKNNGMFGLILVLCVLLIFLDHRIAILTALGIPIAFCATLAVMGSIGLSINLVTMFGLIIVLGMLVDDGIIVAENCSRYLEKGLSAKEAAVRGTQEVAKPVTATIITTIAAFSPLLFMEGMLGKFIWGIPLVVIIALSASLFEALVILPSHFSDFCSSGKKFKPKTELPWFKKLISFYEKLVNKALSRRYQVLAVLIFISVITFFVASRRPFVLFGSEEGIEEFSVRAQAPIGTSLYATNEFIKQVEEQVAKLPSNEIDAYRTQVGSLGDTWMFDPYGKSGAHVAQITIYLTPQTKRKRKVNDIMDDLRKRIKTVEGFKELHLEKPQAGPAVGKPIAVKIRGDDFSTLDEISKRIIKFLNDLKGVSDITSDYELGKGEIRVVIDNDQATRVYLSVNDIAQSVRNVFKGGVATSIKPTKAEEEINVLVRFPEKYRNTKEAFLSVLVPNKFGNLIPLAKVAKLEEVSSMTAINHLDGKRVIKVSADVDNKNITSSKANQMLENEFNYIEKEFPGYDVEYGGEQEENVRAKRSFIRAFILAFFLIFFILATNFNSLIQPIIVMLAIPFGFIGVIWAFFFHGLNLSFFMMMGIVGLMGIVVNDSIVLVEFINNLRRQGAGRRKSIVEAGKLRLRPVLLTTITTALGLTPTAYGIGGGDPFLKPMALTIVWGIICATALTLVVLPCIYAIIDDLAFKAVGHATVKENSN